MTDPLAPLTEFIERGGFERLRSEFESTSGDYSIDGWLGYDPKRDSIVGVERTDDGDYQEVEVPFVEFLGRRYLDLEHRVLAAADAVFLGFSTQAEKVAWIRRAEEALDHLALKAGGLTPLGDDLKRSVRETARKLKARRQATLGYGGGKTGSPTKDPSQEEPIRKKVLELVRNPSYFHAGGKRDGLVNLQAVRFALADEGLGTHLGAKQLNRKIKAALGGSRPS